MRRGSRRAMSFVHNFRFRQTQRSAIELRASVLYALLAPALLLASASIVRAQTMPAGHRGVLQLSAGATGSFDTIHYGSRQMYGVGAFVAAESTGHFGPEAEERRIEFPTQLDNPHAETYSIGGRWEGNSIQRPSASRPKCPVDSASTKAPTPYI